jgi:serine/threonine protein kinase
MTDGDVLAPGAVLNGRYRVRGVLGRGGFGVTYDAQDSNGERVAIKEYYPYDMAVRQSDGSVMPHAANRDNFYKYLGDFRKEAEALAAFDHPNIVHVLGRFEENGTGYFVMDFEEGETLSGSIHSSGRLTTVATMLLAEHLIDVVKAVHDGGLVHRDIKPANVILATGGSRATRLPQIPDDVLRRFGRPVLLDFGAARFMGAGARTMTAIATPGFGAPEQMTHGGRQDARTDIYALAATFYCCLAGEHTIPNAMERHQSDTLPPAARRFAATAPANFLNAIDRGLQLQPDYRPSDIRAFRAEIFADLNISAWSSPIAGQNFGPIGAGPYSGTPSGRQPPSSGQQPFRPAPSGGYEDDTPKRGGTPLAAVLAGVFVAVGLIGGGAYWWLFGRDGEISAGGGGTVRGSAGCHRKPAANKRRRPGQCKSEEPVVLDWPTFHALSNPIQ